MVEAEPRSLARGLADLVVRTRPVLALAGQEANRLGRERFTLEIVTQELLRMYKDSI
jgi:hypothetical protein